MACINTVGISRMPKEYGQDYYCRQHCNTLLGTLIMHLNNNLNEQTKEK